LISAIAKLRGQTCISKDFQMCRFCLLYAILVEGALSRLC